MKRRAFLGGGACLLFSRTVRAEANAAAGRLSLQALFDGATELVVDPHELDDWDSPQDVARTMPIRTMS